MSLRTCVNYATGAAVWGALFAVGLTNPASAQDATWLATPGSGDFNTGTNWSTGAVPTGTAFFGSSNTTNLSVSSGTTIDGLTFNAGASDYAISIDAVLFINGAGITINGGSAIFTNNIATQFFNSSTAGSATIINNSALAFNGTSTGGTARLINGAGGLVDISNLTSAGMTIGSIEGAGTISLGSKNLAVGGNNMTTAFSGVLEDGGTGGGTGASVTKEGTGTLTLSGVNTYTGGTTVSNGALALNHVDGNNLFDAAGSGGVTLDGGKLVGAVTGSLAQDVTFNAGKTSILAAAAGTTLTLGGDPNTTGNQPARMILGANAVAQFGSATETGVVQIGASSNISLFDVDSTSRIVVAGGTLRDFQDQLFNLTAAVGGITVNAGATLDFNDSAQQTLVNLTGAGSVMTGTTGTNTLSIFSTVATNTFSGVISGSHPVSFNTTGGNTTVILSGDNTYTGGTTICFCVTLQLGDGGTTGSILGDVVNENRLIFNRSNTYAFDGVISDTGDVVQNGTGNTVLTALNTYTGATTVNAGTLSVNGDISSSSGVTVNSGGTLGGAGTVSTTVVNAGGALAPGNSIGTITVSGNLTFNAGSSYNVEVSPTAADRTNVTGTATLAGTVNASYAAGAYTSKQYTILNATGGVTGTFDALVNSGMPRNIAAALSYDANNVYLDLSLIYATAEGSLNTNQQNVSNTLSHYFDTTGEIPTAFTLLDANGLSQLSGEGGAAMQQSLRTGAGLFMNSVFDNAFNAPPWATGQSGGAIGYAPQRKLSAAAAEAYAAVTPRDRKTSVEPTSERRWSVWAAAYGGNARVSGDSGTGSHDTTSRVYGMAGGVSWRLSPRTLVGFALGGAGSSFGIVDGFGSGKADAFNAALYGRHTMGPAYAAAALGYSWHEASTDRTVTAGGTTDILHASFRPQALTARLEGGWRFATAAVGMTPYAGMQTTTLFMPSYGEAATSGTGLFALSYGSRAFTLTRGELGARFDRSTMMGGRPVSLKSKAAWANDWNNDPVATATFQTLPGATFTVNGAKPAADAALLSFGADVALGHGWSAGAAFDGEFSRTMASYAGKGSLRYSW